MAGASGARPMMGIRRMPLRSKPSFAAAIIRRFLG
jgi:hypothetical protein